MGTFRPPGECPACGAYVEAGSLACDECGSCEQTGWSEESDYDGLDLPNAEMEDAVRRRPAGVDWVLKIALALVAAALVYQLVR